MALNGASPFWHTVLSWYVLERQAIIFFSQFNTEIRLMLTDQLRPFLPAYTKGLQY